ncbi:PREDICTED: C-type lectin mannose-binding isoform-like [Branchiostoma belcheri]|uniref:C-type lectin mannose-binding isoform-like n=1 Tax=Branchiostoma belcheri TaxID=7741 RepID=A0A6P5ALB1_BRABE|nr:PREDICTED: C-type lectin mannose-binding isoform-like [Branchiostoma belcheri]
MQQSQTESETDDATTANPAYGCRAAANNAAPDSVAIGNGLCKKLWLTLGFLLVMGNAILVSYFAAQVMTLSAEVANLTSRGSMGPPGPPGLVGPIGPPGQKGCSVCPKVAGHPQASGPVESNEASCPEGYTKFRETCYKAFNTLANFGDSALHCHVDGGTLAMPRDAATDAFLISLKNAVDDKSTFWFGLHDRRKEGSFEWIDGSALGSYNYWAPGEPNNKRVNENCVHYWPFYYESACANKWNDEECDLVSFFICQVAPGTSR